MTPVDPALERVLSEIYLRLRQGKFAEARERLAKAKDLAPDAPAVLEIEGDIDFAQHKYRGAETLYREALARDPQNSKLEEKFARTLLKVHEPDYAYLRAYDDSLWSNRVPRKPIASALLSALLPGLGQLFNGDLLKGIVLICCDVLFGLAQLRHLSNITYYTIKKHTIPYAAVLAGLFSGINLLLTLLLLGLWIYAIVDAWMVAKETR